MLPQQFALLAAGLSIFAGSRYIVSTLKGETQPNRVTWSLFTLFGALILVAELSEDVGFYSLIGIGALLFNTTGVLLSSFVNPKAYWKSTRRDYSLGVLALIGLVLWQITDMAELALIFAIAADALATMPTAIKAYQHPSSENGDSFVIWTFAWIIMVSIIDDWRFIEFAFPIYLVLFNGVLAYLTVIRPRRLKT